MKEQIKNNKEQAITERQPPAAVSMHFYNIYWQNNIIQNDYMK